MHHHHEIPAIMRRGLILPFLARGTSGSAFSLVESYSRIPSSVSSRLRHTNETMTCFWICQVRRRRRRHRHPPYLQRRTTRPLSLLSHVVASEHCSRLGDPCFSETISVEMFCSIQRLWRIRGMRFQRWFGCSRNQSELFRGIPIFFRHRGSSFLFRLLWRNVFANA